VCQHEIRQQEKVMQALCLVAHPDDCVIFGYSYIYNHSKLDWTVGYLTCTADSDRGIELDQFWRKRQIKTTFLNFVDHWHDNQQQKLLHWTYQDAAQACWNLAKQYSIVLTHDQHGDYGHIHHRVVHNSVCSHPGLITFAKPGTGTDTFQVPLTAYDPDELPLHATVIKGFHHDLHANSYHVPEHVQQIVKEIV
jgi:hypothetical protein